MKHNPRDPECRCKQCSFPPLPEGLEQLVESVEIAEAIDTLFNPLPGHQRPVGGPSPAVRAIRAHINAVGKTNAGNRKGKHVELEDDTRDVIFRTLDAYASEQLAEDHSTTAKGWQSRLAASVRIKGKPLVAVDWRTLKAQLPLWGFPDGEADLIAHLRRKRPDQKPAK